MHAKACLVFAALAMWTQSTDAQVNGTTTTTVTPWDSSASSSGTSDSLASSNSASLHTGSSGSDSSGSVTSSGSKASGSSGSYLELWQWLLLTLCCCLKCGALAACAACMGGKKPKK